MIIESKIQSDGQVYDVVYFDADSFDSLPREKITQSYGVCFYNNKMVVGYRGKKNTWGLIGGTIEKGESPEDTLKREIIEESNTKVVAYKPIGYQEIKIPDGPSIYQLRYCCLVEPIGEFIADPDSSITKIVFIDPLEYKKYFDWGEIGERIIQRALEIKKELTA